MASLPRIRSASRCVELQKRPATMSVAKEVAMAFDLQQVQADLVKAKEQLGLLERSKSSLVHDLARAKKSVDHLTIKVNSEMNEACTAKVLRDKPVLRSPHTSHGGETLKMNQDDIHHHHHHTLTSSFMMAGDQEWKTKLDNMKEQYDAALMELQINKQALAGLKNELLFCVEAKDEAVRLAGEAMSAAESTARRVEELSCELFRAKIESINTSTTVEDDANCGGSASMEELTAELELTRRNLLEATMDRERIAREGAIELANRESSLRDATELADRAMAEAEILKLELAEVRACSEAQVRDLTVAMGALKEAVARGEAEKEETMDMARAMLERAVAEKEEAERGGAAAAGSLARAYGELERAHELLLAMALQETVLSSSLELLHAQLQQSAAESLESRCREQNANAKVAELTASLTLLAQKSEAEIRISNERETSALARLYLLQAEVTESRWESEEGAGKYSSSSDSSASLQRECKPECGLCMLEPEQHDSSTNCKLDALVMELEENQVELQALKEQVFRNNKATTTLMCELEKKESELAELHARLSEMEVKARALTVGLFAKKEQCLVELRTREVYGPRVNLVTDLGTDVSELLKVLGEALKALSAYNRKDKVYTSRTLDVPKTSEMAKEAEIENGDIGENQQKIKRMFATSSLPSSSVDANAAVEELEKVKGELVKAQAEARDARATCMSAQNKLQHCLRELDASRSRISRDDMKKRRLVWSCMRSWIPLK